MSIIKFARALRGAAPFNENNINETYRGLILVEDGSTRPAILKDLDPRQLANELLAAALARATNLPVPDVYLALSPAGQLDLKKAPANPNGDRLIFASGDVMAPNLVRQCLDVGGTSSVWDSLTSAVIAWSKVAHLYAFDTWIANIDRHPGNLLIGGKSKFWLIDHGHAFTGPNWTASALQPDGSYINRLSQWLSCKMSAQQKSERAKQAVAFAAVIDQIDVPQATKQSLIEILIPPEQVEAVSGFLKDRMQYVPSQTQRALGLPTLIQ